MTGTGRITNTGLRHDDRGVSRWLEIVARNHEVADEHVVDAVWMSSISISCAARPLTHLRASRLARALASESRSCFGVSAREGSALSLS